MRPGVPPSGVTTDHMQGTSPNPQPRWGPAGCCLKPQPPLAGQGGGPPGRAPQAAGPPGPSGDLCADGLSHPWNWPPAPALPAHLSSASVLRAAAPAALRLALSATLPRGPLPPTGTPTCPGPCHGPPLSSRAPQRKTNTGSSCLPPTPPPSSAQGPPCCRWLSSFLPFPPWVPPLFLPLALPPAPGPHMPAARALLPCVLGQNRFAWGPSALDFSGLTQEKGRVGRLRPREAQEVPGCWGERAVRGLL